MVNLGFLANYKTFLKDERQSLLETQFEDFASANGLPQTAKLRRSFSRLMDALDDDKTELGKRLDKIYTNNFLFDVLSSIPNAKERDLRKTTQAFCTFLESAGVGNKIAHRAIRSRYANSVTTALSEVDVDSSLRKSPEFKNMWTTDLKERLNTKRDK